LAIFRVTKVLRLADGSRVDVSVKRISVFRAAGPTSRGSGKSLSAARKLTIAQLNVLLMKQSIVPSTNY
jgi:hypothetical protein